MPEVELLMRGYSINTDQGRWGYSTVTLIRGENNILVDTGPHGRRDYLSQVLSARGLSPEDIGIVVLTHAHWDHTQNIDIFPNARVVVHPSEIEYSRSPKKGDWATARYFEATLQGREVQEARDGLELEAGVKIMDTPGHTKGHISVLVETSNGTAAIAADALTAAGSVFTGKPYLIFWDEEQAAASVKRLLDTSRLFYPGHDRPFRVGQGNEIEYIGGEESIRIFGSLGHALANFSLTIAPEPERQVWVLR